MNGEEWAWLMVPLMIFATFAGIALIIWAQNSGCSCG